MKSKDRNSNFKFNKMKENTRLKRNVNDLKLSIKILNVEIEVLREENRAREMNIFSVPTYIFNKKCTLRVMFILYWHC